MNKNSLIPFLRALQKRYELSDKNLRAGWDLYIRFFFLFLGGFFGDKDMWNYYYDLM